MMDVPTHLLQPLSVDTNIIYDLDITRFPGLDDPQQMYQPALLIAADWSDYVYADEPCNTETEDIEDDLYDLIESCHNLLPDVDSFSAMEPSTLETLLDDVISDNEGTVKCYDLYSIDACRDNLHLPTCPLDDTSDLKELSYQELSPLPSGVRGQKRRRSSEYEFQYSKKSKKADNTSLHLPCLVSVCPTSNVCVMHRDS